MQNVIYTRTYEAPEYNRAEMLRYAGVRGNAPEELEKLLDDCICELDGWLSYRVCFSEFPVNIKDGFADLGFLKTQSALVTRLLAGCEKVVLFAATVGLEADRLIARYGAASPSRALMIQAIAAERIESLCDAFCNEVAAEAEAAGYRARPRFSPGYGDLKIEVQRDIFAVLNCPKNIGVSLNDSLIMSPSKSVTAFVGLKADGRRI